MDTPAAPGRQRGASPRPLLCAAGGKARRGEARRRVARTRLHASPTTTANGSGRGKSKRGKGCGGPEGRSHASLLIPAHTAVHPTPPQTGPAPARPSGNTPPRGPRRHGGPQHLASSLASEGDLPGLGDRPAAPRAACRREPAHRARTHTHTGPSGHGRASGPHPGSGPRNRPLCPPGPGLARPPVRPPPRPRPAPSLPL